MPGNGYAYAVAQTQIGAAIETTRGVAVAPKFWLPVKAPKYAPDITVIPDETLQGSMVAVYNDVLGLRYDKHGWDSFPYLDSFPLLVRAELGSADTVITASPSTTLSTAVAVGATTMKTAAKPTVGTYVAVGSTPQVEAKKIVTVTGTVAPFTVTVSSPFVFAHAAASPVTGLTGHKFSLLNNAGKGNQPPSVTITDYDGEEWRQLTAAQLDELTIKGNATGFVDYTCTWFANPSTTPTAPTPSFSSVQALPGWSFQGTIGGGAPSPIIDWEFDFKRGVKPIPALTGTQAYLLYFADVLQATGKITVLAQTGEPELNAFLKGVQEPLDFSVFDVKEGFVMDIHSSKAMFKTASLERGKEEVEVPLDVQLLPTATDATAGGVSPCTVTVWNATATAY